MPNTVQRYQFSFLILVVLTFILLYKYSAVQENTNDYFANKTALFRLNPKTKAYEIEGKPIIWQYWDTDQTPLYVKLLIEAMQCRNLEFQTILVHDSTIYQYLPDFGVPEEVFRILIGQHKADIFRIAILLKYGGIYADVDTFVLDKVYPMYELLTEYDIVTANWGDVKIALGAIGPARAGITALNAWHKNQLKKIDEKFGLKAEQTNTSKVKKPQKDPFGWADLLLSSSQGVNDEINSNRTIYRGLNGYTTVGQLVQQNLMQSASSSFKENFSKFLHLNWTPFLFLHGSKMKEDYFKIKIISELIPAKNATLYSAFVGCALVDCEGIFGEFINANRTKTPVTQVDLSELMTSLKQFDRDVCEKFNHTRSINFTTSLR